MPNCYLKASVHSSVEYHLFCENIHMFSFPITYVIFSMLSVNARIWEASIYARI